MTSAETWPTPAGQGRRGQRKVEHAALDEGPRSLIDDDALAAMGDPELGAERQQRWAAVMAFWLKRCPSGLLPDSLP
jgi:hypothetical protein